MLSSATKLPSQSSLSWSSTSDLATPGARYSTDTSGANLSHSQSVQKANLVRLWDLFCSMLALFSI
jgi:hypothetical protein